MRLVNSRSFPLPQDRVCSHTHTHSVSLVQITQLMSVCSSAAWGEKSKSTSGLVDTHEPFPSPSVPTTKKLSKKREIEYSCREFVVTGDRDSLGCCCVSPRTRPTKRIRLGGKSLSPTHRDHGPTRQKLLCRPSLRGKIDNKMQTAAAEEEGISASRQRQ